MSPATRKSKRAAAVAASKQEEPGIPAETEERPSKKQKEDPQPEKETVHLEHSQREQKLDESGHAMAEPHAPLQISDAGSDVAALNRDGETGKQLAEGNEGEGGGNALAAGYGDEQEEADDKEEVDEAEETDHEIHLGDTGDNRVGDDENVEEPGSRLEPDEKQRDDTTANAQNNGVGSAKAAAFSRQEDGAFSSRGKIFIGGVTPETTADTLQKHFGKYGEIIDAVVMKHRNTGHPRGFGFVTFADPSVCDKVLKDAHIVDGRTVEAKQTVPHEKGSASSKGSKSKKIFVGGLTTTTTEDELKVFFEKFGKVIQHQILQDHKTGRSRGFGFVTFDSEEVVESILSQGCLLELGGKQVEVKVAEPQRAGQEFAGSIRPVTSGGGGFSRGYGACHPYFVGSGGIPGGGHPYGGADYRYGGGLQAGYGNMGLNYRGFGSGPSYGYNYGGGYGGIVRAYGGRYHPYGS